MSALKRTALYDVHKKFGAKMAAFAGYDMPIQYAGMGVLKEQQHTRSQAGLFDVSHMGQVRFHGKDREAFVEWVTPADVKVLAPSQARLSMITNARGGVIDDCIVTRFPDYLSIVINAGCKDKDIAHFQAKLKEFKGDAHMEIIDKSLLSLQGPTAHKVLGQYVTGLDKLPFMHSIASTKFTTKKGSAVDVHVTRCGYTGEDGFEISATHSDILAVADALVSDNNPAVQWIGLGARDCLRLEAGLNLYGHELNEDINPVAARIMWCITKRRMTEGGFVGHDKIKEFRDNQALVPRLRVGIVSTGPVARENALIQLDGKEVGKVTSGSPSPTLGKNVAIGYLDRALANKGQKVQLNVRSKLVDGEVVTLPFVPLKYFKVAN